MGQFAAEFLSCEAEKVGARNHGDVGDDEDPQLFVGTSVALQSQSVLPLINGRVRAYQSKSGGHKWPEYVDKLGQRATAPEAYPQKLERVYALPPTLPLGSHTLCDLLPLAHRDGGASVRRGEAGHLNVLLSTVCHWFGPCCHKAGAER